MPSERLGYRSSLDCNDLTPKASRPQAKEKRSCRVMAQGLFAGHGGQIRVIHVIYLSTMVYIDTLFWLLAYCFLPTIRKGICIARIPATILPIVPCECPFLPPDC